MIQRRQVLAATVGAAALPATGIVSAQGTKIVFGYTAVTDFASAFVAAEEGLFKKRGLDVELKFIPINSTIPAAIQSDSLQIGGPTPSVFLQAVDGGLDHVVVAGGGATSKASVAGYGLLARNGSNIKTAADCVGKKVGVPGLGAFLHVTYRLWLKQNGVDHKRVNFIEAAFPQHGDLLRGGTLDAVVSADPFMARNVEAGVGYVAARIGEVLPDGAPSIIHTARRDWAEKNSAAVAGWRAAILEAAEWMAKPANDGKLREYVGKYTKLPPEVVAKALIAAPQPVVTAKNLDFWVGVMRDQDMLKAAPNTAALIAKG